MTVKHKPFIVIPNIWMVVYSISTIVRHTDQKFWRYCIVVSQRHLPHGMYVSCRWGCMFSSSNWAAFKCNLQFTLWAILTLLWLNGLVNPPSLLFFFLRLCSAIQNKYLTIRQRDEQPKVTFYSLRHSPPPIFFFLMNFPLL